MQGTLYHGRYCILLMGLFATYSGFIYNELFSVPLELWSSTLWCSGEMNDPQCAAIPGTSTSQLQKWPVHSCLSPSFVWIHGGDVARVRVFVGEWCSRISYTCQCSIRVRSSRVDLLLPEP